MTQESFVQVNADGSGKKIRNIKTVAVYDDGSEGVVYTQAVVIIDGDGKLVSAGTDGLLAEMKKTNDLLENLVDLLTDIGGQDLRGPMAKSGIDRPTLGGR